MEIQLMPPGSMPFAGSAQPDARRQAGPSAAGTRLGAPVIAPCRRASSLIVFGAHVDRRRDDVGSRIEMSGHTVAPRATWGFRAAIDAELSTAGGRNDG